MSGDLLGFGCDFVGHLLLRVAGGPFVDVFLLDMHGLLVQFELLLVGTHAVEEFSVAVPQLRVEELSPPNQN